MASTTPRQRVGNLPAEVSSFVDRREEIAETKRLLSVTRLLTLTGVGGVGKTRLALRVAADLRRAFANGVWLVELAGLQNPHLVVDTVVEALGIDDRSTRGQLAVLIHYLRGRQLLLVLDNCEHLRSACAILVDALLRAAKGLRVLATSRQVLDTDGERAWQVPPLPAPDPDLPLPPRAGARYPALALFAERATARGFVITADTQGPVARICHRLDGIPLAIELAAVRLRTMQPEQILQRLDDRFGLLTAGTRTALPRHQTLRAAIEWSFDLCTREEQLLWARASVFADGFDLATAEEVCAGDGLAADVILDLVAGLVDKSVLICEEHAGTMRYRLLDTLRQYGRERLRYAGEQEGVRRRHRNWYLRLAEQGEAEWFGPHQATWFARMRLERANIRAALDFCLSEPDEIRTGLRMAAALWFYWSACGFPREGRHWLDRALALDTGPTREGVRARWANGWIALQQGHIADGESTLTECRALARQLGDASTLAHATHRLGFAALLRGDLSRAVALLEESLTRFRFLGELNSLVIMAQVGLAAANVHQGDLDRAMMLCEEARAICEGHGEQWARSYALYYLAYAEWGRGETQKAAAHAAESLRIKRTFHDIVGIVLVVDLLAWTAAAEGMGERAARLLGVAHQLWSTVGLPRLGSEKWNTPHKACEARARRGLGNAAFEAAFQRGNELALDEALEYALDEKRKSPSPAPAQKDTSPTPLTRRERQVAALVAEGLSNKDIAARLVIAQRTAEGHVQSILTKLGVTSRTQIAAWATERRETPP
jgi:predicted ATPase/DNA-binding CsgD family transcriptional regulator